MRKLQLMLAAGPGGDARRLAYVLLDEVGFVKRYPGGTFRLALRDEAARAAYPHMGVPEFAAVLELGVPEGTGDAPLVARAAALGPLVAPLIDGAGSVALLGDEDVIVPGEGGFQLFRCMTRKEGLTLEQFSDHWRNIHAEFGRKVPGRPGYRQLHRDPAATSAAAKAAGVAVDTVDGDAQLLFADERAVALMGTDPEQAKATAADGALFVDRSKAMGMIAHVVATAGPLV